MNWNDRRERRERRTRIDFRGAETAVRFQFHREPWVVMKRISQSTLVLLLAALLVVSAPSWAHHGTTAYDPSKTLKLKGTVMEFKWVNPHASLAWDVTAENGGVEHWIVELTSPGMLTRSGWHHDSLKPGGGGYCLFPPGQEWHEMGNFPESRF